MTARERKYALDTNVYINASRDDRAYAALQTFNTSFAPFVHLSAVVMQELRAGVHGRQADQLQRGVFRPFENRGRVFTPTYAAWKDAAAIVGELVDRRAIDRKNVQRSFLNDVLLAASCREAGIVLITDNTVDFKRIASVRKFDFVAPWPTPTT